MVCVCVGGGGARTWKVRLEHVHNHLRLLVAKFLSSHILNILHTLKRFAGNRHFNHNIVSRVTINSVWKRRCICVAKHIWFRITCIQIISAYYTTAAKNDGKGKEVDISGISLAYAQMQIIANLSMTSHTQQTLETHLGWGLLGQFPLFRHFSWCFRDKEILVTYGISNMDVIQRFILTCAFTGSDRKFPQRLHRTRLKIIVNIWNLTPSIHTNSHFKMWAEKMTIMDYIAMIA